MKDYERLSREELIERLAAAESKGTSHAVRHAAATPQDKAPPARAHADLLDSAERLRAILETAVEAIITIDERGVIESVNRAAETIFGYRAEELIGRNVKVLMPAPFREQHDGYLANYRDTGHAKIIGVGREVVAQRKDGTTFPIDLSVSEVRLTNRRMFTGFIRDITERKKAENSLLYHSRLVASSDDAIIGKTLDSIITSWNHGAERIFGFTAAEAIGQPITIIIPEDRLAEEPAIMARIKRGESLDHFETVRKRKDNRHIEVSVTISPIHDATGAIIGVSKLARDITNQKRAEAALKEASEQRRLALEVADLGTWDYHFDTGKVYWDERCRNMWGIYEGGQIDYAGAISRIHPDDRAGVDQAVNQALAGVDDGAYHREFRAVWPDGSVHWITSHGRVFFTGEGANRIPVRFIGANQDVTGRKRAEEQLAQFTQTLAEKNKELETIVYVASHDLRSPLVNIQGFSRELTRACESLRSKLLADSAEAARTKDVRALLMDDIPEALEYIQAGVAKIDTLLSGFLRYSRLGRAALKIERLSMDEMLSGITNAMEFQIKQTGASVRVEKLPDCLGDATQVSQVFSNLLDNALKYLDSKRTGMISVTGRSENGRAIYMVQDNGIGIAKEHQEKIFEIFHRLNPAHGEGEGLGLTIAQRVLERQNGRISVESEPGRGSRFTVTLPAPPAN